MRGSKTGVVAFGVVLVVGAIALGWRRMETGQLRAELAALRGHEGKLARAREENARLVAGSVTSDRLAAMRAEQAESLRLRREIAWFRQTSERPALESGPSAPVPAGLWKNAGRDTPSAALETALWAAAGGDVDRLAATLEVDHGGRSIIEARFRALPQLAQEYETPERLVAYFTTKDVPLGTMEILAQKETGPDDATRVVRLRAPDGKTKDVTLALHRSDDGWRLKVPVAAVMNYLRTLVQATRAPTSPSAAPGPSP